MSRFLQNFNFDQISFWIGVITGALGLWLANKIVPSLPQFWIKLRTQSKSARSSLAPNHEELHRQDTLRYVQRLHLSAPLFSIEEILIEPQLMIPPLGFNPEGDAQQFNILDLSIPYLPDWPELNTRYSRKSLPLAKVLGAGANIILMGNPGSGKTVTLAHLVCQIVRRDNAVKDLANYLPVFVHISDLLPKDSFTDQPIKHILLAVRSYANSLSVNRQEKLLEGAFQNGRSLLMIDGLDEVPRSIHKEVIALLDELFKLYPHTRLVISSTPENISGLTDLGLHPIAMAAWNERQYFKFIRKWGKCWLRYIEPTLEEIDDHIDPRLLNAWLLADNPVVSPFAATMKVWAAFAGDTLGPDYVDAIESYIWRITEQLPNIRTAVEDFALQMIASQKIALDLKQARGLEVEFQFNESDSKKDLESTERKKRKGSIRSLPGALPNLLESRLMVEHMGGRLSFSHPLVTAYLASAALANAPISHFLSNQEDWSGKTSTLSFLITSRDLSPEVSELLEINDDPLLRNPLKVGRWLSYTSKTTTWRTETLRYLAEQVQRENIPLGLRARLLSALLLSNDPAVNVLLGQISHTSIKDLRRMVALGLGYLLDSGSLSRLSELLEDPDPSIYRSACLALVRIGNKQAFELLGTAILHGNEDLQRTVAEALALNPADGHEMLKEASQMEDLMVRRSSVYGLIQIQKPWAREILEGLAVDDQEWVVRAAATQALEEAQVSDLRIPEPLIPLHETTWLISYAGERGMGIAPGKPAQNLLISVLADGSPEQQLAALGYLKLKPDFDALPLIQKLLDEGSDDLIQAAYDTLWYYAAEGLDIQSPSSLPVS